jgi:hypothetical protein
MSRTENEVKEDGEGATALKIVLASTYRERALWYFSETNQTHDGGKRDLLKCKNCTLCQA